MVKTKTDDIYTPQRALKQIKNRFKAFQAYIVKWEEINPVEASAPRDELGVQTEKARKDLHFYENAIATLITNFDSYFTHKKPVDSAKTDQTLADMLELLSDMLMNLSRQSNAMAGITLERDIKNFEAGHKPGDKLINLTLEMNIHFINKHHITNDIAYFQNALPKLNKACKDALAAAAIPARG